MKVAPPDIGSGIAFAPLSADETDAALISPVRWRIAPKKPSIHDRNHEVVVAAPVGAADDTREAGLRFEPLGDDPLSWFDEDPSRRRINPVRVGRALFAVFRAQVDAQFDALLPMSEGVDAVIGQGMMYGAASAAEQCGVPYHYLCPNPFMLPSAWRAPGSADSIRQICATAHVSDDDIPRRSMTRLHGPIELGFRDPRLSVVHSLLSAAANTAAVMEHAPGEHHEGLFIGAEVAVPPALGVERMTERFGESLTFVVGRRELEEGPRERLACVDVSNIGARDLRDSQRHSLQDASDSQALGDERSRERHASSLKRSARDSAVMCPGASCSKAKQSIP